MGYRTYIGSMPKREYNKIKSMTEAQLIEFYKIEMDPDDDPWHKSPYEYGPKLFEFGKYTNFQPPKKSIKPFFKNVELQSRYNESEFSVVTKEFLAYIIDTYKGTVTSYYNQMVLPFYQLSDKPFPKKNEFLASVKKEYISYGREKAEFDFSKITPEEQSALCKMIEHVISMGREWTELTPFSLDFGPEVTDSWKIEYVIFELVRVYKTFDWRKNVMLYYGY